MYDSHYKKILAESLDITDLSFLDSIVGEEEFKSLITELDSQNYSPGVRLDKNKIDTFDL